MDDTGNVKNIDDIQLDYHMESIVYFLKCVHPFLNGKQENGQRGCVEIRPLPRREEYEYRMTQSLNLWDLNEQSIQKLKRFVKKHIEYGSCLYYSVFAYDYDKEAYLKSGKKARKGRVNNDNALFTQEIVLDFDGIDQVGYEEVVMRMRNLGLDGMWVWTGHGYQVHILLDERVFEKDALAVFVEAFSGLGFACDVSCRDAARLMRLPATYNYKCLSDDKYVFEEPALTRIVKGSDERYRKNEVLKRIWDEQRKIGFDEEVSNTDEVIGKVQEVHNEVAVSDEDMQGFCDVQEKPQKSQKGKKGQRKNAIESQPGRADSIALERKNDFQYPYVDHYNIPEPINKMLNSTPDGLRNKALGFLIRYLKTYVKLSKKQIEEILTIWAKKACQPPYDMKEFVEDLSRLYYYNGLNYDSQLAQQFGFIDFENQNILVKNMIFIPQSFLEMFHTVEGNAVRVYLGLKMLEHFEKETTIDDLAQILDMTSRAIRPILKNLIAQKHIYVKKGNRRLKEPNRYFTTKIVDISKGYLKLSYNDVKAYVDELALGELKLYLFMSYKFFNGDCFMSQKNIGKNIGLEQNTVSELVKSLESKDYLRITKVPLGESKTGTFLYSNIYTMLR